MIRQPKPVVYEDSDAGRRRLDGRYVLLAKNLFGFEVPDRDLRAPLTIDPVLVYSAFVGGSSSDWAEGIALDSSGRVYVTGGAVYSTYLGGTANDYSNAYVVGWTESVNFPVTPAALQPAFRGETDAFVVKLNPRGTHLGYSTYLGGSYYEWSHCQCEG